MPPKLIFFTGVYDTLDLFTRQFIREFTELGYETLEINTNEMAEGLSRLARFVQTPVKAAITFNNLAFNLELSPGKNTWDELGIPCVNILMDHPFCYPDALKNAPKNAIILCVDKKHMDYITRFYPHIPVTGFLAHGGISLGMESMPIKEREIDVMYAGGLARKFVQKVMPEFNQFPFDARLIADEVRLMLLSDNSITTEQAVEDALKKHGIFLPDAELSEAISKLHYVELLVVSYYREKLISTLLDAGIRVHLYGPGWDICDFVHHPNLVWEGRISAKDVLEKMRRSKIVLNTMTWFKDGTHDRVFNGMLAGAVAVSDESLYMKEEFLSYPKADAQSAQMVMFQLKEMARLAKLLKNLLSDPDTMQKIADNGRRRALKAHTWRCRAKEIEDDLLSQL